MVELRRKSKPTSEPSTTPKTPEDWISRANADGQSLGESKSKRYISFAIDNITLGLFRDICFDLDKGNVETLVHIIENCANLQATDFESFPESCVVFGNTKRTMSFQLSQSVIDKLNHLAKRLRFRNKSALYRYLIQFYARSQGVNRSLFPGTLTTNE
jgi:hypothetical protein